MNKNVAIAAVALFGVTLALAVLSPAMATKPDDDGNHKVDICHFAEAENVFNATGDGLWHNSTAGLIHLEIDHAGQLNGHFNKDGVARHGNGTLMDIVTDNPEEDCIPAPIETVG